MMTRKIVSFLTGLSLASVGISGHTGEAIAQVSCFRPKEPVLLFKDQHPNSLYGGPSCLNPSDLAARGYDTTDALGACYQYTVDEGHDQFALYTSGQDQGRCCPKEFNQLDVTDGFNVFAGNMYIVHYEACLDSE